MAEAGADCVIAHMGLTVGGSIGLERGDAMQLEEAPAAVQAIGEAAWAVNRDAILLCHGGPDRHARGRRPTSWRARRRRLRRGQLDGAPAGRDRDHRDGASLQADAVPKAHRTCRDAPGHAHLVGADRCVRPAPTPGVSGSKPSFPMRNPAVGHRADTPVRPYNAIHTGTFDPFTPDRPFSPTGDPNTWFRPPI